MATDHDEISVIARVNDHHAWEEASDVRPGSAVSSDKGTWIVTGRIPIEQVSAVRARPFVLTLKAAQPLRPQLNKTVEDADALPGSLPTGSLSSRGRGTVVGIIDYGCDFAHENFRGPDGSTRLLGIWHQGGPLSHESPFGYGRFYSRDEINTALGASDPHAALGYGPQPDHPLGPPGAHGTHVMDIAADNGRGSGVAGMAPEADLLFVDLTGIPLPLFGPGVVQSSLGDSAQLLDAMRFLFDMAGDRPCVVNVSLGTNGGPHDGTTPVERFMDDIVAERRNRAVVVAAGNAFNHGIHVEGRVEDGGTESIRWMIPHNSPVHAEFELWYPGSDRFSVDLLDPYGGLLLTVAPGANGTLVQSTGEVSIHVANRLADPNNGDNVVGIFIEANAPGGEWTIRLHGEKVDDGTFHAWIERDNLSQTRFVGQAESEFTLGSLSCGRNTIVVGSYDGHEVTRPLSFFSASGPTRDGRQKPDICAPGHDVLAARSGTRSGVTSKKGTSMAAPAVAGAVALLLAEAARGNRALSSEEIRDILIGTAVPMTNGAVPWDPPSGFGRLSVGAALRRLLGEGDASGLTVLPGTPVPPIEMADPAATGPEPDEASVVDPPGA